MTTFKQVIDLFIEGATKAQEATQDKTHAKLVISGNSLLWVTEDMTYIAAIRLSDKLFVKNITWHNRPPISNFRYITRRCRSEKVHLEKMELAPLQDEQPGRKDRLIKAMEGYVAEQMGRDLEGMPSVELSEPQRAFKKQYMIDRRCISDLNTLKATKAIYIFLEKHGTGKIDKPTMHDMINTIKRTRKALDQIDSFLQVCITLPEISSPGIIEQDEHPGGVDSCSSPLSESNYKKLGG